MFLARYLYSKVVILIFILSLKVTPIFHLLFTTAQMFEQSCPSYIDFFLFPLLVNFAFYHIFNEEFLIAVLKSPISQMLHSLTYLATIFCKYYLIFCTNCLYSLFIISIACFIRSMSLIVAIFLFPAIVRSCKEEICCLSYTLV